MLTSDRKQPREVVVLELGPGQRLHNLSFNADGSLLACGRGDKEVRLYDPTRRDALVATLPQLATDALVAG